MEQPLRIVLVEDDPMQAEWIVDHVIMPTLPHAEVRYFDSEHLLFQAIETGELQRWSPQFAILDLLMCYYSLDELAEMDESPNLENLGKSQEAGIRCRDAVQKACPDIKIGIITVLDETPDGFVIRKGDDDSEKLTSFLKQLPAA